MNLRHQDGRPTLLVGVAIFLRGLRILNEVHYLRSVLSEILISCCAGEMELDKERRHALKTPPTFLKWQSRDTVARDRQTISCPDRRTTLQFLDVNNIGSFLPDTSKRLATLIGTLNEMVGRGDQHADMQACPGAKARGWAKTQQDVKAIIYLPDDTHVLSTISEAVNQQKQYGPCRRVFAAAP